jgi:O-antigen/teichoic acid export membrane protein
VAGLLVSRGIWFVLTPLLLHYLGATRYGLWVLIDSIVGYAVIFEAGGADALQRYVARFHARGETAQASATIASAVPLFAATGLAILAIGWAVAALVPQLFHVPPSEQLLATRVVRLMALGVGVSIVAAIPPAILRALQRYDVVNLLAVGGTLLTAGAAIGSLLAGWGLIGLIASGIAVTLFQLVPAVWGVRRVAPSLHPSPRAVSRASLRALFRFGTPLFVHQFAGRISYRTDEIVIAAMLPVSMVTPYALARRLAGLGQILARQFVRVLLPVSAALDATGDPERQRILYLASTRLTLALCLPLALVAALLGGPILAVWVGGEYARYGYITAILGAAIALDTALWPLAPILQGVGRPGRLALAASIAAVANLGASIMLIYPLGLAGVALGTVFGAAVGWAVLLPYALRVLGVSYTRAWREALWPAVLPVVTSAALILTLARLLEPARPAGVIGLAVLGLAGYAACYFLLSATALERQTIREAARRVLRLARAEPSVGAGA